MVRETPERIVASPVSDRSEPGELDEERAAAARERMVPAAVWFIVVAGLFLFLLFGSVTLHYSGANPHGLLPSSARVIRVWIDQAGRLPRSATEIVMRAVYYVLIAVILIGSAIAMWLTLVAKSDPVEQLPEAAERRVDIPAEPPAPSAPEAMGEAE